MAAPLNFARSLRKSRCLYVYTTFQRTFKVLRGMKSLTLASPFVLTNLTCESKLKVEVSLK